MVQIDHLPCYQYRKGTEKVPDTFSASPFRAPTSGGFGVPKTTVAKGTILVSRGVVEH